MKWWSQKEASISAPMHTAIPKPLENSLGSSYRTQSCQWNVVLKIFREFNKTFRRHFFWCQQLWVLIYISVVFTVRIVSHDSEVVIKGYSNKYLLVLEFLGLEGYVFETFAWFFNTKLRKCLAIFSRKFSQNLRAKQEKYFGDSFTKITLQDGSSQ